MAQKTILILAANPIDTERIRLDKEVREIAAGLRRAQKRDQFVLQQEWAVRPLDFRRAMLDHDPQIVHFSGHGLTEGICFEDDSGHPAVVPAEALSELFALFPHVECVLLNACYSESQAEAITQHVPYAIGISDQYEDERAIDFAVAFYDGLGAGKPVEFAFNLACVALRMARVPAAFIPVLKIGRNKDRPAPRPDPDPGVQGTEEKAMTMSAASALQVQFPYAITCEVSRQELKARIGRIELKNTAETMIPAGWRARIALLRPYDFRITLLDTVVLPAVLPDRITPIGPFVMDIPRDIAKSEDAWHLELYIIDPHGNEFLTFRSGTLSFT